MYCYEALGFGVDQMQEWFALDHQISRMEIIGGVQTKEVLAKVQF